MSLYLGNTSKGGVLHVTSDYRASYELAGDPITSTVFHSSLPYLDLVTYTDVTINKEIAYDGYSIRGIGASYTGLFTATIPDSLFQYFNNNYLVMVQVQSRNSGYVPFVVRREASTSYNDSYYNNYNTYSTGARTFTNSTAVPIGGGYYNNPYTNMNKIQTQTTPDSTFRYLILSFGESGPSGYEAIYLQSSSGVNLIDDVLAVGRAYVFNLNPNRLDLRNTYGLSVQLDSSNFIVTGDGNQVNLSNYSFVTSSSSSGDLNFPVVKGSSIIGGLNMFNINKVPATGWNIDFRSTNFSVTKFSSEGSASIINPNISYLKLVSKLDLPLGISHSGDYGLTNILSYNGSYKFFIIFITFTATMNGITVSLPPHYHLGFATEQTSTSIAWATVSVTNNQGGKTGRSSVFTSANNGSSVNLQYNSYLSSGKVFTISSSITGSASILVFN